MAQNMNNNSPTPTSFSYSSLDELSGDMSNDVVRELSEQFPVWWGYIKQRGVLPETLDRTKTNQYYVGVLEYYIKLGLLENKDGRYSLTTKGEVFYTFYSI